MEAQRTRPMFVAYCQTRQNKYKDEIWPNYFSFPPKVGDFVESQNGEKLEIVSIIHAARFSKGKYGNTQSPKAILELE